MNQFFGNAHEGTNAYALTDDVTDERFVEAIAATSLLFLATPVTAPGF